MLDGRDDGQALADVLAEPGGRVDVVWRRSSRPRVHLEVQVAAGRVAEVADLADLLPGRDRLAVPRRTGRACARTRW